MWKHFGESEVGEKLAFFNNRIYILKIKQPLQVGPQRRSNYIQVLGPEKDYIHI
jgi:hypothetical protein